MLTRRIYRHRCCHSLQDVSRGETLRKLDWLDWLASESEKRPIRVYKEKRTKITSPAFVVASLVTTLLGTVHPGTVHASIRKKRTKITCRRHCGRFSLAASTPSVPKLFSLVNHRAPSFGKKSPADHGPHRRRPWLDRALFSLATSNTVHIRSSSRLLSHDHPLPR